MAKPDNATLKKLYDALNSFEKFHFSPTLRHNDDYGYNWWSGFTIRLDEKVESRVVNKWIKDASGVRVTVTYNGQVGRFFGSPNEPIRYSYSIKVNDKPVKKKEKNPAQAKDALGQYVQAGDLVIAMVRNYRSLQVMEVKSVTPKMFNLIRTFKDGYKSNWRQDHKQVLKLTPEQVEDYMNQKGKQ